MRDALLLLAEFSLIYFGLAGVALSQPPHWTRLLGKHPRPRRLVWTLRLAGYNLLLVSFFVSRARDRAEFAAILWTLLVAVGAAGVACTLTWRPGWLRPLAQVARRVSHA